MKKILGLDLGTNSIGWALIEYDEQKGTGNIIKIGSRIIPMSEDVLGKFDSGVTESGTAERTNFRGVRRLRERHLLRRERLHRVLHVLDFLPAHYDRAIDFERRLGQFIGDSEPKIAYRLNEETKQFEFVFKTAFAEMVEDFKVHQPALLEDGKLIPYDWTIYYLRKKALTEKIAKEELAWLLLNFNQKRGYGSLREEDEEKDDKIVEVLSLKILSCEKEEKFKNSNQYWYSLKLEGGYDYKRTSENGFADWIGKYKDFIITKEVNEDGSLKYSKDKNDPKPKISIEILPTFDEIDAINDPKKKGKLYKKIKIRTETTINNSGKTVGWYIYDTLLANPNQKINGQLVRVIDRNFYENELGRILKNQQQYYLELQDKALYKACLEELYEYNENHRNSIGEKDFVHLFLNDLIFYQRPLKSKKSLISDCRYESRSYIKDGAKVSEPLKCIAKSHPLFQEFRLWQWLQNLRIYEKDSDKDVTSLFLKDENDWVLLFDWLNERKEVDNKALLTYLCKPLKLKPGAYRWNYVYDTLKDESKKYPCNETKAMILNKLEKAGVASSFLTTETEEALWHILYSVSDKQEIEKALNSFATKQGLGAEFVEQFKKFPPFKSEYGAFSAKAIKKLLPLMRVGKYWSEDAIHTQTKERIEKIINAEYDSTIQERVREKAIHLSSIQDFKGLPLWLTSYIVYDRHSEEGDLKTWKTPADLVEFLKHFKQHSLRNPIVEQVILETLRVVNDVWATYGEGAEHFFDEIHIELGREMKNPADKRKEMTNQINENENTNLRIKALLAELQYDTTFENVRPYSPIQQEILRIYEEGALNAADEIPEDILKISKTAQPNKSDLIRYKLWLQQRYISPYTGQIIPLSKLFTPAYEIEHIIPQSRYFDDSFSNKVICEAEVNKLKTNQLALDFIRNHEGTTVQLDLQRTVQLFSLEGYTKFVKETYSRSRGKMKKLLLDEIPAAMVERQMNDTRYISKEVKNLLSRVVRNDNNDDGTTSVNVLSSNGQITTVLKQDWGLNDIWNELIAPRFVRLNQLSNSDSFGKVNDNTQKFLPTVPIELSKGFSKKRIDHRHHAMDALVIACASRNHINYLNNQHALDKKKSKDEKQVKREDLRNKLCMKKFNAGSITNYKWVFKKPWDTYTQDAKAQLETTVVSFKQNLRVINKAVNKHEKWQVNEAGKAEKVMVAQENKGQSWAIRKPMHKDTVYGLVRLRFKKTVLLSIALENHEDIVDNVLRSAVRGLVAVGYDKKMLQKYFKDRKNLLDKKDVSKVEIYYWDKENVASRVKLDESFTAAKIESITDTGIKTILINHLNSDKYQQAKDDKGKQIAPETLAFSADGIDEMNNNLVALNGGKKHQPIYKVRTFETKGNKFSVGQTGNKDAKYVEAAKGTNLFFAIYKDANGKRNYSSIAFNEVVERQKQGVTAKERLSVPDKNEKGDSLVFHLSPNDLVYVPTVEERENKSLVDFKNLSKEQVGRIYKMVSSTGTQCFFIKHNVSVSIANKNEFSALNKMEKSIDGMMIKEFCWKIGINRVGEIVGVVK